MADAPAPMRLRAQRQGQAALVKVLMAHSMDTGLARDSSGQIIPAWFIQQVEVYLDSQLVLTADWGPAVSRNPFLEFELTAAPPGATLALRWRDNRGESREDSLVLP